MRHSGFLHSVDETRVAGNHHETMPSLSEQIEETDVYQDLCWEHLSEEYVCSRPLVGKQTTYTECCCLYGEAWGMQCALCPMKDSGEPGSRSHSGQDTFGSRCLSPSLEPDISFQYLHVHHVCREGKMSALQTSVPWFISKPVPVINSHCISPERDTSNFVIHGMEI